MGLLTFCTSFRSNALYTDRPAGSRKVKVAAPGFKPGNAQPSGGQPPDPVVPTAVCPPTPSSVVVVRPFLAKSAIWAPRFAGSSGRHPPAAKAPASDEA